MARLAKVVNPLGRRGSEDIGRRSEAKKAKWRMAYANRRARERKEYNPRGPQSSYGTSGD
jgi:hypothetical protein